MIQRLMTVEQFLNERAELPDAGQWAELVRGVPVIYAPPDPEYGTVILNLSKLLAEYVQRTEYGYPVFDVGLHVESRPDTVRFPAVSYFVEGQRFSETDREITTTVPPLVVEVISNTDRRRSHSERINQYHAWGVSLTWTVDCPNRSVIVASARSPAYRLCELETLSGTPLLDGLSFKVQKLFEEPEWAK